MSEELRSLEELGKEFKTFLQSNVGRYIDGCTLQDIERAKDELLEINPYSFSSLVDLQNKLSDIQRRASIASSIRIYIAEAVTTANQALHQLENEGQE